MVWGEKKKTREVDTKWIHVTFWWKKGGKKDVWEKKVSPDRGNKVY